MGHNAKKGIKKTLNLYITRLALTGVFGPFAAHSLKFILH